MPKIATKFIADVTLRVGRQTMSVKIPMDFADMSDVYGVADDTLAAATTLAKDRLDGSMKMTIANASALKKAYKVYKKAHP